MNNPNQCSKCKWVYPKGIVQPAFLFGKYSNMCGPCYEQTVGHELHAPLAREFRDKAIQYRKNNPNKAPK